MEPTPTRLRAFFAVELSDAVRVAVSTLAEALRDMRLKVSWVPPENLHLTLRFLGDVESETLEAISARVAEAVSGVGSFTLRTGRVGVFPNARRPSVIWVGIDEPPDALFRIQLAIETIAREAGFEPERRSFEPHITIGRVRRSHTGAGALEVLERHADFDGGEFEVKAVSLFSSRLTPQSSVHTKLRGFAL